MTTMSRLQALSLAFQGEERAWYRGLTALDQTVIPVVQPEGFLSLEELTLARNRAIFRRRSGFHHRHSRERTAQ